MLESALARFLHHYLGKYVLDFDADNLNVGVFSGDIRLTDLTLKPEALYELDLPIAVKYGKIESVLITVPWSFLRSKPVVVAVQGVWLVAEPCTQNGDVAREKRLIRAARQNALAESADGFLAKFIATLMYNLQISLSDIHIRYEDNKNRAAFGICLQSLYLNSTDKKWKPLNGQPCSTTNAFQTVKFESFSTYWDPDWDYENYSNIDYYTARNELSRGLQTFSIYGKPLNFIVKPITLKMKITIRLSDGINHIQIDASLGDFVMLASKSQLNSMRQVRELLQQAQKARNFIALRPHVPLTLAITLWWKYAFRAVLQQRVHPYCWDNIKKTRMAYKEYRDTYIKTLTSNESELKLDLLKCEDKLTLTNIILAREEAKLMIQADESPAGSAEVIPSVDSPTNKTKLNLAIGNGTFSLYNGETEICCMHVTQLAICAEQSTVSLRLHTLLVEGVTYGDHLAPVISSPGYDSAVPIFSIEVKKKTFDNDYSVKCRLDTLEFVYNSYLISELSKFIEYVHLVWCEKMIEKIFNTTLSSGFEVDITLRDPRFLVPESGCIQKDGSVLVITPGKLQINREGSQEPDLEAGLAELEERLYTRWKITFNEAQILVSECGEAWREALDSPDSVLHFMHRCSGDALVLFSICPDDKRLPMQKYNVTLFNLRISFSLNQVSTLLEIIGNVPRPKIYNKQPINVWQEWESDLIVPESEIQEVLRLKRSITPYVSHSSNVNISLSTMEKSTSSGTSDIGDEIWTRTVDLPGFEDNVSPSNPIITLIRFVIIESCWTINRSEGKNDRPFLQLRLGKTCIDGAFLSYGPALQVSIENLVFIEQVHTGMAGQYLEIASSAPGQDIFECLYRKVRADCPDFRSYFRSVENSLIVDVGNFRIRWRSDACKAVLKTFRRISDRVRSSKALRRLTLLWKRFKPTNVDPPIPPGAVKFSRSLRVTSTRITLADFQKDLIELLFKGLEYDCMFRANEKLHFKLYLNALTVEDLSNITLFPKIISMEDDFVLELKYVGHTSHIRQTLSFSENLPCDGNLRLQLGRIHIVPLGARGLERLLRPIPINKLLKKYCYVLSNFLLTKKLLMSFQIGGPTLLIPQKLDSPNVIIVHKGDISVENFVTETPNGIVDNILVKVEGSSISRAVMTLAGSLQIQGSILDPLSIRLDIKHNLSGCEPMWNLTGSTDVLRITLGQCDISTILALCSEHIPKARIVPEIESQHEQEMHQLQAFLSETIQVLVSRFTIDGICIEFVSDSEEVLSSPVRDLNRSLCQAIGKDTIINASFYSDSSWTLNLTIKDIDFIESRLENNEETRQSTNAHFNMEFTQSSLQKKDVNITFNDFQLKLSTVLITHLYQFIIESSPGEWNVEGGLENQGYEREAYGQDLYLLNIRADLEKFGLFIRSDLEPCHLYLHIDMHFNYGLDSFFDFENIYLELQVKNDQEWIINPFDVKIIHTITQNNSKIMISASEIKTLLTPKIYHNMIKIFNEMHITLGGVEVEDVNDPDSDVYEDMWLPRKLQDDDGPYKKNSLQSFNLSNETVLFSAPSISFLFTLDDDFQRMPLLLSKISCNLELRGFCTVKLSLQSNYYNASNNMWEPFLEPIVKEKRPYQVQVNVFRTTALPINAQTVPNNQNYSSRATTTSAPTNISDTSADSDTDSGENMSFIRPPPERVIISPSPPHGEQDSDLDDDVMEKITHSLAYLFTSESSEDSESLSSETDGSHNTPSDPPPAVEEQIEQLPLSPEFATYIIVDSEDTLNLTLTSQSIVVLKKIIQLATTDYSPHVTRSHANILINNIGDDSLMELTNSNDVIIGLSKRHKSSESTESSQEASPTNPSASLNISSINVDNVVEFRHRSATEMYSQITQNKLKIRVPNLAELVLNCPIRSCRKLLRLNPALHGIVYYIILDVVVEGFTRTITTRSPLQIHNQTSYVLGLYYEPQVLEKLKTTISGEPINPFEGKLRITLMQPHQVYNVPLFIAFHSKLFIQPAHLDSNVSESGFWWEEIGPKHIEKCYIKTKNDYEFFIGVKSKMDRMELKNVPTSIPYRTITLLPPVHLFNCLPRDLRITLPNSVQPFSLEPSTYKALYEIDPLADTKLILEFEYYGVVWTGAITLCKDFSHKILVLNTFDSNSDRLNLMVKVDWSPEKAACCVYVYSPYWIVNRTGLDLQLKGCGADVTCIVRNDVPTLWSWPRGIRRRCVRLRIIQASWSTAFSLDSIGCIGRIVCRDRARKKRYRILISMEQARATPLTTLIVLVPLFNVTNHSELRLRFMEENEHADLWFDLAPNECIPFWPDTDTMHMHVKYEESRAISQRFPINKAHFTVLRMDRLLPALCVSVTGGDTSPFTVAFSPYRYGDAPVLLVNRCTELFLKFNQRGLGQTALLNPEHSLLYTWDDPSADKHLTWNVYNNKGKGFELHYKQDEEGEQVVEDTKGNRVAISWISYMDGPQRIVLFAQNRKVLSKYVLCERSQYEFYLSLKAIGISINTSFNSELTYISIMDRPAKWEVNVCRKWKELSCDLSTWIEDQYQTGNLKCKLRDFLELDLNRLLVLKPFFGDLRRSYSPGLWIQHRQGLTKNFIHIQIQKFQIDNQLSHCTWPTIFYFPDNDVACFDLMQLWTPQHRIIHGCSVSIRDCRVLLDREFIRTASQLIDEWGFTEAQADKARTDLRVMYNPIGQREKEMWHMLQVCFAPFTIELNAWEIVDLFKNTMDTSRVQQKPVNIRCTSIVIKDICSSLKMLLNKVFKFYSCKTMQQFYALVLGQAVLLNVQEQVNERTFLEAGSTGASGLAEAAKRLLGHIRGAELPHTATFFPPSSNSFVSSRVNGDTLETILLVAGLCGNLATGEHLIRTSCRNLFSLMTRDIMDNTWLILETIQRAQNTTIAMRARLTRVCDSMYLEPFSYERALGKCLLEQISDGGDFYWAHVFNEKSLRRSVLLTLTHVFVVRKKQIWGSWDVEWKAPLDSIIAIPYIEKEYLILPLSEEEANKIGIDKYKIAGEVKTLTWLKTKIEESMVIKIEDEQWCG